MKNLWENEEHITLPLSPRCGTAVLDHPSWSHAHTSQLLVGRVTWWMRFDHFVSNGSCSQLQTEHFPALPCCYNLSTSQPLYSKSLTISESNKENKEEICEFYPSSGIKVQSSLSSVEQDAPKAMDQKIPLLCLCCLTSGGIRSTKTFQVPVH